MIPSTFRYFLATVLLGSSFITVAADTTWLTTGSLPVSKPVYVEGKSVKGEDFGDKFVLTGTFMDLSDIKPVRNGTFLWNDKLDRAWMEAQADTGGYMHINSADTAGYQLAYHAVYISSDGLYDYSLKVESPQIFEIYLGDKRLETSYKPAEAGKTNSATATLNLDKGKFLVIIRSLYVPGDKNDWRIKATFTGENGINPVLSNDPSCGMTIHHLLEGIKLGGVSLLSDGSLIMVDYSRVNTRTGQRDSWTEIKDVASGKLLQSFRKDGTGGYRWMPSGKKMYYTKNDERGSTVWVYDFVTGKEYPVLKNVEDLAGVNWSLKEDFIIYGISEEEARKPESSLKYMNELGNRTFRTESATSLYRYDIASGISTRLSYGSLPVNLDDISRDGNYILFSTSIPNDTVPPFNLQSTYLMNLSSGHMDTLWKDSPYGAYPQFSPDGTSLLVIGGPDCFDGIGKNIGKQPVANSYDQQLFILDLATRKVDPLTRDFNPSVETAVWSPVNRKIYFTANDQMYIRAFEYDTKRRTFTQLNAAPEVITSFSLAGNSLRAAYVGNNLASPPRSWIIDLSNGKNTVFDETEYLSYKYVTFGKSDEWDFISSDGTTIRGYFIYPANFNPEKKYPLIVNYYGGVTPTDKSFGGRYPQDIWACEGYVVYVPQPSGAIGFGQEFSARHQNNWGLTVADEIIEGTKKFIASHPFVDSTKIGCIGASYGGFMTMLLQTKTNMFTCAISHAGISSISSYWGEGYWGYWYNTVASLGSYPWNRKDLYVDQSPLFSADKITTPLLLLHGSSDVNVPLGESLQLWVGLKILGRPVEMVQIEGEDHHILTYSKRIEWHNTIMAWFDKWLKGEDHDWKKLFPASKL